MPYYALTAARPDMHLEGSCDIRGGHARCLCDCTHFCYTPQFARAALGAMLRAVQLSQLRASSGAAAAAQGERQPSDTKTDWKGGAAWSTDR